MKNFYEICLTKKFWLISAVFFLLIAAYTLMKELQSSVFMTMVGVQYVPIAKSLSFFVVIPIIFIYSYAVDKYTNRVLFGYSLLLVGMVGIVFTILTGTDSTGLLNTVKDPWRVTGWFFYWYIDLFPVLVGTLWAFTNAVHESDEAKKTYSFFVSSSKIGGMLASGLGYVLSKALVDSLSDVMKTQIIMGVSAAFILLSAWLIIMFGSQKNLLTEEQLEKPFFKNDQLKKEKKKIDVLQGLKMLVANPYALGIFFTVFSFEIVNQIINYQRLIFNDIASASNLSNLNSMLYGQVFFTHFCGFLISIFGTTFLLNVLGIRKSLIIVPIIIFLLVMGFLITREARELMIAYTGIHVLSYALAYPLRENLYTITSRDIKFKVKAWIDSIGAKTSKISGQGINKLLVDICAKNGVGIFNYATGFILAVIVFLWIIVAVFLGKRYHESVAKKEIIK